MNNEYWHFPNSSIEKESSFFLLVFKDEFWSNSEVRRRQWCRRRRIERKSASKKRLATEVTYLASTKKLQFSSYSSSSSFALASSMKNKNNRIIIKPGRTHACMCCLPVHTIVSRTSYQLRAYSIVDDLRRRKNDHVSERERTWRYVCMIIIELLLDTEL